MKKYKKFLESLVNELRYSIFDWDDNILVMDTPIHFKHLDSDKWVDYDASPKEFVQIKEKYPNYCDNPEWKCVENSFYEFRDFGPRGNNAFLYDTIDAIKNKDFGPSWEIFINTLINGELFAIVTSRGHEPDSIRKTIEYIIYNHIPTDKQTEMLRNLMKYKNEFKEDFEYLVDEYLDNCYYIGIMSQYFKKLANNDQDILKSLTLSKKYAINYVIENFSKYSTQVNKPVKIGFSDDDNDYLNVAKHIFMSNKEIIDDINFYLFDTSNPNIKGGKKYKI